MSEQRRETIEPSNEPTSAPKAPRDPEPSPASATVALAREAEGRRAARVSLLRSSWRSDSGRRPVVRHSLGPDDPQHGFDG